MISETAPLPFKTTTGISFLIFDSIISILDKSPLIIKQTIGTFLFPSSGWVITSSSSLKSDATIK